jgi:hypothetical protein
VRHDYTSYWADNATAGAFGAYMVSESSLRIESITDDGSSPVDLTINSTASSAARPITATKRDLLKARFEYEQVMGVNVSEEPLLPHNGCKCERRTSVAPQIG